MSCWSIRQSITAALGDAHIGVITQLWGIQQTTIVEQLRDQLAGAHTCVAVREREQSRDRCNNQHLQNRVVTQPRGLTPATPRNVCTDEESPPDSPENTQQDKGYELQQVPRGVELHVEEHQPAVTKRVDGPKGEGRHQRSKERAPQRLQREIITHLQDKVSDSTY